MIWNTHLAERVPIQDNELLAQYQYKIQQKVNSRQYKNPWIHKQN